MESPQPPQYWLKVLRVRLNMAWNCLFSRKALLFIPSSPAMLTCIRAGSFISSLEYGGVAFFAQHLQAAAKALSEEKLLADLRAEAVRIAAIEADIAAILANA